MAHVDFDLAEEDFSLLAELAEFNKCTVEDLLRGYAGQLAQNWKSRSLYSAWYSRKVQRGQKDMAEKMFFIVGQQEAGQSVEQAADGSVLRVCEQDDAILSRSQYLVTPRLANAAFTDLNKIDANMERNADKNTADTLIAAIFDAIRHAAAMPEILNRASEGLFEITLVPEYKAVCQINGNTLDILCILHVSEPFPE